MWEVTIMKRMRNLFGVFLMAAVFATQPGCMYLMGKAAWEVGKEAGKAGYKKVKGDLDEKEREKENERYREPARDAQE